MTETAEYSEAPESPFQMRGRNAPSSDWREMSASDHFVQFYESDDALVNSISGFIGAGLEADETCIVIATPEHRANLDRELKAFGIDVAAARSRGQYISLDASETLSKFMYEDLPDPRRFVESVGQVVAQAEQQGRRIRAFGEMVALLWAAEKHDAAIALEALWNELAKSHCFSLFCAYPMDGFGCESHAVPFNHICTHHTRVIPAESYASLSSADARLREITALQQKAKALEAEIAQRKEVEATLFRRERELSDFFDNALEGLRKMGPDGTILWANKAELDLFGCKPEEVIGHHISEFHADPAGAEEMLAKLLKGEDLYNHPAEIRCKDGSIKHVLVHSNACIENGNFVHTRCFTRDVTDLRDSEIVRHRLAAIVDSSDDAIIGKTLDGIITSWNAGAERLFGYTAEEAIGRPKTLVFPPDLYYEEDEILARLRRGERIDPFEAVRMRKDGRRIDVSLTLSPIKDSQGTIVGASTIARDITEARQAERERAELNARLKRSITETHHRVKNNLQVMTALIEMQKQSRRDMVPMAELVRLGQNVQALGVIHDILTQEAREDGDSARISIKGVLERLLPIMEGTFGGRRLRAAMDEVSLPGKQTTSLALITNELVSNAIKHGKGDVELTLRAEADTVTLEVCDDGPGFPEGFDPEIAAHTGLDLIENIARFDLRAETSYRNRTEGGGRVTVTFAVEPMLDRGPGQ